MPPINSQCARSLDGRTPAGRVLEALAAHSPAIRNDIVDACGRSNRRKQRGAGVRDVQCRPVWTEIGRIAAESAGHPLNPSQGHRMSASQIAAPKSPAPCNVVP